ncbi:hypothetical protein L810_3552 [Burkholderia sp. AU4i]|nr:hypothetical protein L810_3552 [Burkholderia sp. AU4i]MDW9232011.1 hypothetical protein [Burkholderia cepacia]MDW9248213.1 hypothetical protein [Burkholderia cepacia]QOH38532.1 hypothetical protein C7S14_0574 [Burkholderia cepacia]
MHGLSPWKCRIGSGHCPVRRTGGSSPPRSRDCLESGDE